MEAMIFAIAILAAGLVMASGVWVATVLVAAVAHAKRPAKSGTESPVR
jgi:hypothetical protein